MCPLFLQRNDWLSPADDVGSDPLDTPSDDTKECPPDDNDHCYRRWERENSACNAWKNIGDRAVQACRERASNRRNLCVANGGAPNSLEPPEYNPFHDFPR